MNWDDHGTSRRPAPSTALTAPTLNEDRAVEFGSSRGLRTVLAGAWITATRPRAEGRADLKPARAAWLGAVLAFGLVCVLAGVASAQSVSIDFGDGGSLTLRAVQVFVLITLLSLAPGLAIMVTCFPFMVTVLAILRQAIGLQQAPPNMMIVSLALFLTYFVMEPVFREAWDLGLAPLIAGELEADQAVANAFGPFQTFMAARTDPSTLETLRDAAPVPPGGTAPRLSLLIPAFLLSEIQRGFEVGFLVFLPFLVIDLVIAAILMSMGMMMVPPAIVALPFKLAFFVLADGWTLLAGALVRGYGP